MVYDVETYDRENRELMLLTFEAETKEDARELALAWWEYQGNDPSVFTIRNVRRCSVMIRGLEYGF